MNFSDYIGKAITYYREQKGWTTVQLANESGLSQGYISQCENGRRNPSEDALEKIVMAFGITLKTITERAENLALSEKESQIIRESSASYDHMQMLSRAYRNNDFVYKLSPDILLGFNMKNKIGGKKLKESQLNRIAIALEHKEVITTVAMIAQKYELSRAYRNNDFVYKLSPDILLGFNIKAYHSAEPSFHSGRRRNIQPVIAQLTEKVFLEFLDEHMNEIAKRLDSEFCTLKEDASKLFVDIRKDN